MEWNNVLSKCLYKGKQGKCGQDMVEKKSIKKAKKKKRTKRKRKRPTEAKNKNKQKTKEKEKSRQKINQ